MSVSARVPVVDGTPPRLEVRNAAGSVTVEETDAVLATHTASPPTL